MTTAPGELGTPPASSPHDSPGPRRARSRLAGALAGVAVALALTAAFSPWWYVTSATPGTSTSAYYYPGTETRVVSSGGGGTLTYSEAHVPSLGVLYAAVLAGAFLLAVAAAAGAVYALRGGHGAPVALRRRGLSPVRVSLLVAIVCGLILAVAVPALQPTLFASDNPSGACSGASPPGECQAFWGSSHSGLTSTTWGAGSGWWLGVVGTALLMVALLLVIRAGDPAENPASAVTPEDSSRTGGRLESSGSDPRASLPETRLPERATPGRTGRAAARDRHGATGAPGGLRPGRGPRSPATISHGAERFKGSSSVV